MGIPIIVAYDRDFRNVKEYLTPKEFVKLLKKEPVETPY